jgi:hypothetical protein
MFDGRLLNGISVLTNHLCIHYQEPPPLLPIAYCVPKA